MRRLGIAAAVAFLLASAFMNFRYGHSLGRSAVETWVYGGVGVLAVVCNALCPFFLAWHATRYTLRLGIALLWTLCLAYSLTSAIGFAAENREALVGNREAARGNYETTVASLEDLEAKRTRTQSGRYDARIEALRDELKRLRTEGANLEADPQARVLSTLTFLDMQRVRIAIVVLFAVMVELGAALVLFAAVTGETSKAKAPAQAPMWRPKWQRRTS